MQSNYVRQLHLENFKLYGSSRITKLLQAC